MQAIGLSQIHKLPLIPWKLKRSVASSSLNRSEKNNNNNNNNDSASLLSTSKSKQQIIQEFITKCTERLDLLEQLTLLLEQKWISYTSSIDTMYNLFKNNNRQQRLLNQHVCDKRRSQLLSFLESEADVWFMATASAFKTQRLFSKAIQSQLDNITNLWNNVVCAKTNCFDKDESILQTIEFVYRRLSEMWNTLKSHFVSLEQKLTQPPPPIPFMSLLSIPSDQKSAAMDNVSILQQQQLQQRTKNKNTSNVQLSLMLREFEEQVERLPVLAHIHPIQPSSSSSSSLVPTTTTLSLVSSSTTKPIQKDYLLPPPPPPPPPPPTTTVISSISSSSLHQVEQDDDEVIRLCETCHVPVYMSDYLGNLVCPQCTRLYHSVTNVSKEMAFRGGGHNNNNNNMQHLNANSNVHNVGYSTERRMIARLRELSLENELIYSTTSTTPLTPEQQEYLIRQQLLKQNIHDKDEEMQQLEDDSSSSKHNPSRTAERLMPVVRTGASQHQTFINKMKTVWIIPSVKRKTKYGQWQKRTVDDKTMLVVYKKIDALVAKRVLSSYSDLTMSELESLKNLIKREDKFVIKAKLGDLYTALTGRLPPTVTAQQLSFILQVRDHFDPLIRSVFDVNRPLAEQPFCLGSKRSTVRHFLEATAITLFLGYYELASHIPIVTDDQLNKHGERAKLVLMETQRILNLQNVHLPTLFRHHQNKNPVSSVFDNNNMAKTIIQNNNMIDCGVQCCIEIDPDDPMSQEQQVESEQQQQQIHDTNLVVNQTFHAQDRKQLYDALAEQEYTPSQIVQQMEEEEEEEVCLSPAMKRRRIMYDMKEKQDSDNNIDQNHQGREISLQLIPSFHQTSDPTLQTMDVDVDSDLLNRT